jgi:cell division protein FtsQ
MTTATTESATDGRAGTDTSADPRRPRRTAWIGLVLLIGVVLVALASTPLVSARSVQVTGAGPATADAVRASVEDVALGRPLMRLDLEAVEAAAFASSASIGAVEVSRDLRGRVVVAIEPRRPVVAWIDRGSGQRGWVDAEGVLFKPGAGPEAGVPALVVDASLDRSERRAARESAANVVAALPEALRTQVRSVQVRSLDDLRLRLSGDRLLRFGSATEIDRKAAVALALLEAAPARGYDVSAPDLPTTTR